MKKLLFIALLSISYNALGQCSEQSKYNAIWRIDKNNANVVITKKNQDKFIYYDIKGITDQAYIGFRFVPDKKINYLNLNSPDKYKYGLFMITGDLSKNESVRIRQFFLGDDKFLSSSLISINMNQIYEFPLSNYYKVESKEYKKDFNMNGFVNMLKPILNYNHIYGNQKIKYYVNLINNDNITKCSMFESPVIEYDFGR